MMPLALALDLIDQFARLGGQEVILTGGEPLEHDGYVEMLERAKTRGMRTCLFSMGIVTNGKLFDGTAVRRLKGLLDLWVVSLHAGSAPAHDDLTGGRGSFDETCAAIQRAAVAGIEVQATFFAYPGNAHQLRAVAGLCDHLGITSLRVLSVVPQGRAANQLGLELAIDVIDQAIEEAARSARVKLRLGEATKAKYRRESDCQAISSELVVNCDGWISPCHSVEPTASTSELDNAFLVPLAEVLRSSPRLSRCRSLAKEEAGIGCTSGCLARQALLGVPSGHVFPR